MRFLAEVSVRMIYHDYIVLFDKHVLPFVHHLTEKHENDITLVVFKDDSCCVYRIPNVVVWHDEYSESVIGNYETAAYLISFLNK